MIKGTKCNDLGPKSQREYDAFEGTFHLEVLRFRAWGMDPFQIWTHFHVEEHCVLISHLTKLSFLAPASREPYERHLELYAHPGVEKAPPG